MKAPWSLRAGSLWLDLLRAVGLALLAGLLAAQVDLSELLFSTTRRWEPLQLDEWPTALLVFAVAMVLLYARRHAQLQRALRENRFLVGRVIEVQEEERRRLARELHDELGQTLNAIKLDALSMQEQMAPHVAGSEAARRIVANADQVYRAAGGLVRNLRPPALDELGLAPALEACVERWRETSPQLVVQLAVGGRLDDLGEMLNITLYRIVQEAMTNCVRHAHARHLYIDLTRAPEGGDVTLEIRDDGTGIDGEAASVGGGLAGMRERVAMLGGEFQLLSGAGRGVTIRVELPVHGD